MSDSVIDTTGLVALEKKCRRVRKMEAKLAFKAQLAERSASTATTGEDSDGDASSSKATTAKESSSSAVSRSAVPEKEDNMEYNLGDLAAFDLTPVASNNGETGSKVVITNAALKAASRDAVQLLVNMLFTQVPQTETDSLKVAIIKDTSVRPAAFRLPRQKPVPKQKAQTKWEKFAEEKGIQKKKRSALVYDDTKEDWVRRWGYKSIKHNEEAQNWVMEHGGVATDGDSQDRANPFEKLKAEKKLIIAKQKFREMRNKVESAGFNLKTVGLGDSKKGDQRGKEGLQEALRRSQISSASSGKFDRRANNESVSTKTGKRNKVNTAISKADEKGKYMRMLEKLEGRAVAKGENINFSKAASFAQQEKERGNQAKKMKGSGPKKEGVSGKRANNGSVKKYGSKKGKGKGKGRK